MEEDKVVVREEPKTINNTLATLALIVAAGALVLAWVAYDQKAIDDTKEVMKMEKAEMDAKMEDAAEKTGETTREATGEVIQKAGEAMEATGEAAQKMGTDVKTEDKSMSR